MWVAKRKCKDNNIQQNNECQNSSILSQETYTLLHHQIAKYIKQRLLINKFKYLECPIRKYLVDQIIFFKIKLHLNFINLKLVNLIKLWRDFKFLVKELIKLNL